MWFFHSTRNLGVSTCLFPVWRVPSAPVQRTTTSILRHFGETKWSAIFSTCCTEWNNNHFFLPRVHATGHYHHFFCEYRNKPHSFSTKKALTGNMAFEMSLCHHRVDAVHQASFPLKKRFSLLTRWKIQEKVP